MARDAATATVESAPTVVYSADTSLIGLLAGSLLTQDETEFTKVVGEFRDQMAPRDHLELMHFVTIVTGLAMFRKVVAALPTTPLGDMPLNRAHTQAQRSLNQALKEYRKLRERDLGETTVPAAPAPVVPEAPEIDDTLPIEPVDNWEDRVEFPPEEANGKKPWPLVRGTRIEVEHVMSLLSDDWPASRILAVHPNLTFDDLCACKGCDVAGLAGPPPA